MGLIIRAAERKPLVLNETDTVKSVMQNVGIIVRTRVETVPLYREFGCRYDFLDRPVTVASPILIADMKEAIERFEPRARVVRVAFSILPERPGVLMPEVEVEIIEQKS